MRMLMVKKKYIKEKIILYLFKILICCLFTGSMYYCWIKYFNPYVPTPFFKLGNYFLAAVLLFTYVGFVKIYGGFLVGTSPVSDLMFSQIISIAFLQAVAYVIFSLLSYRLVSVLPFLVMFLTFSAFAVVWVLVIDFIYFKLHAPKKTIVVFNNVDSYQSIKGIRDIKKRFRVTRTVNSEKTSLDELYEYMKSVDAVFLCGVIPDSGPIAAR